MSSAWTLAGVASPVSVASGDSSSTWGPPPLIRLLVILLIPVIRLLRLPVRAARPSLPSVLREACRVGCRVLLRVVCARAALLTRGQEPPFSCPRGALTAPSTPEARCRMRVSRIPDRGFSPSPSTFPSRLARLPFREDCGTDARRTGRASSSPSRSGGSSVRAGGRGPLRRAVIPVSVRHVSYRSLGARGLLLQRVCAFRV